MKQIVTFITLAIFTYGSGLFAQDFKMSQTKNLSELIITQNDELPVVDVNLYPNPATSFIILQGDFKAFSNGEPGPSVEVFIFDEMSNIVHNGIYNAEQNFIEISVSDFESGLYYIRLISIYNDKVNFGDSFIKD